MSQQSTSLLIREQGADPLSERSWIANRHGESSAGRHFSNQADGGSYCWDACSGRFQDRRTHTLVKR